MKAADIIAAAKAGKSPRRKPSKNMPYVFWDGWRDGCFEAFQRDPGPLKGVGVVKVKNLLAKLEDIESRALSGFTLTPEFVQQFAQWIAQDWDGLRDRLKKEQGIKNLSEFPSLGVVVAQVPAFLAAYLNRDDKLTLVKNAKPGWDDI